MSQDLPVLTPEEVRVLGCLIEKNQATPEYYPLTLNALVNACNQKSSREPVVEYNEDIVEDALTELRSKGLVAFASGTGRVLKYMHRAGQNGLGLSPAQSAVLSLIMLRGSQTPGEIKARASRQFNFPDLELVQSTIESLISRKTPFLEEAPRLPGQKETRYRHRFHPYEDSVQTEGGAQGAAVSLRVEIETLKETIRILQKEMNQLRNVITSLQGDVLVITEDLYPDEMKKIK